ncbi:uncharacterized protein [Littorina saxatilis]|uniref:uncharacterized protein n=1 Tax=Littorina saxatilis TaxID=31220 RepID=UPI0038B42BC8
MPRLWRGVHTTHNRQAKYGSYSIMDTASSTVLDVQLIQSSEVANSNAMELAGLQQCFRTLEQAQIGVSDVVTDRHTQVRAFLRTYRSLTHPIRHWFDVWHMAKSVYKKLMELGKKKGMEEAAMWGRSIASHLYWVASSTPPGEFRAEQARAKWVSVCNHITGVHTHDSEHFPQCLHGPLEDRIWMIAGSKVHKELEAIVKSKTLVKDIAQISPFDQTAEVEAYHSLVCQFAPKFTHFSYSTMKIRLQLAVIHHNANSGRQQAVNAAGDGRWAVQFPKNQGRLPVARKLKTRQTYGYVHDLMQEVIDLRMEFDSYSRARASWDAVAPRSSKPLIAEEGRPSKENVVASHQHRYSQH